MSCLCIFYHNCVGWSSRNSWSCCILLEYWLRRDIFKESCHSWILSWYHMDSRSFGSFRLGLWHRADKLWWVFGYRSLLFDLPFFELMLCSLGSCCNGGSHLTSSFLLDMHRWLRPTRRLGYRAQHLYPVMVAVMRTIYPRRLNFGFSSKSSVGSWIRHDKLEEGRTAETFWRQ